MTLRRLHAVTGRRMTALLALLGTLLVWAPAAHAAPAPDDLTNWLATDAVSTVLASAGAPNALPEEVTLGSPVRTWTWSARYLSGESETDPVVSSDVWAARITVRSEIMGGIIVDMTEASSTPPAVVWSAQFGDAIAPGGAQLVYDRTLRAWFTIRDGTVRPLTDEAHEVLAGPLGVDLAQEFVRQWNGVTDAASESQPIFAPHETNMVLIATLLMAGLLVLVGIVVLSRKGDSPA